MLHIPTSLECVLYFLSSCLIFPLFPLSLKATVLRIPFRSRASFSFVYNVNQVILHLFFILHYILPYLLPPFPPPLFSFYIFVTAWLSARVLHNCRFIFISPHPFYTLHCPRGLNLFSTFYHSILLLFIIRSPCFISLALIVSHRNFSRSLSICFPHFHHHPLNHFTLYPQSNSSPLYFPSIRNSLTSPLIYRISLFNRFVRFRPSTPSAISTLRRRHRREDTQRHKKDRRILFSKQDLHFYDTATVSHRNHRRE